MLRSLLFRGPEDALIDCWTVVDRNSEVGAAATAVERVSDVTGPPAVRLSDLSVAADYMRWVDAEHGLEDSGAIAGPDYERALSA